MAFPGQVNRYVVRGTFPGGERWATGFYGAPTLPGTAQDLANGFDDASSLTLAMLNRIAAMNSSAFAITGVDVYIYGAGRTIIDQGSATLSILGTSGSGFLPFQTCMVMTLRTATRSGRGRGRMYIPATATGVGNDGLFTAANVTSTVNAVGPALDNLVARVVSEAATTSTEVTSIDADRVPDIQRRRADKLTSSRVSYSFV